MIRRFVTAVLLSLIALQIHAKDPVFATGDGAIKGYDSVAYFDQGKAVEGSKKFSHRWNDADWFFASAENRDRFAANPDQYAPQYGGYCAYAVSYNSTAPIDPEAFSIVDGKLYLNYSRSVQKKWLKKRDDYIADANANWPAVLE